ncbi:flagellar basal body protein FliL [Qaidamihabitans albus]|uniref:flagellar basal body protein FliL n=1 Tax=Qaidamihabitans albus TaxID=2795733 RepID=UPI0018F17ECC|nr:flagellar basal body protein FliL [Qaidamihabitans albus]
MTNPGPGGQWPPQQGAPQQGGYYPPPGPQYGAPQQYPAGPPQQPYPQPGYYQQQPPPGLGVAPPQPPQPPKKSRRGLVVALVAALVLALGGGATWFALSQGDSVAAGAETPGEAAMNLATSLGNGDIVGLLTTLAPAEAAVLTDPVAETTDELKRLGILDQDADPQALTGIEISTENLTFDDAQAEQVNDHLTITKLTGGKLTVNTDFSKVPVAEDFLDAALSEGEQRELEQAPQTETIDIGEKVRETGEPVRIATVKVGDEWYPSLLYTIADYALQDAGEPWPQQAIPANGAGSPGEAVQQTVQAALDGDINRVIELLPPDEMGVLHDAGPVIVAAAGGAAGPTGVEITKLETETSDVTGGTRATLTALELQKDGGASTFALTRDGDCYRMTVDGRSDELCADQLGAMIQSESDTTLPPEAQQALQSLGTGVMEQGLGVVTTEVDGKHYVSPLRTFNELGMTVLRSLEREDIEGLLRAAR